MIPFLRLIKSVNFFKKKNNDTDERRDIINFYEARMAKKMRSGEFMRTIHTVNIINMFAEDSAYRSRRKKAVLLDEVANFETNDGKVIRNIFLKTIEDVEFEQFLIFSLRKMEDFKFDQQPSVNLLTKNDGRGISVLSKSERYERFAQIDLMRHTRNVVVAAMDVIRESSKIFHVSEVRVVLFGCLFHDFGKSIELAKHYGLYNSGMVNGKYKHEYLSEKIFEYFLDEYKDGLMRKIAYNASEMDRVRNVIKNHHHGEYVLSSVDPLVAYVRDADKKAREREMINILNKERSCDEQE